MATVSPTAIPVARSLTNPTRGTSVCAAYLLGTDQSNRFNGSSFHVRWRAIPNSFTASDLATLRLLSVGRNVVSGGSQIRGLRMANGLLAKTPMTSIERMPSYLNHQNQICACHTNNRACAWKVCDELWDKIGQVNQFGGLVVRSKILARKRLSLFPIYDSLTASRLGIGRGGRAFHSIWGTFQAIMQDPTVNSNLRIIKANLARRSPIDPVVTDLTLLRVLDICLWMQ